MDMAEQIYMAVRHAETCGGIMRRLSPDDANLLRQHLVQRLCRHNKEEGSYTGVGIARRSLVRYMNVLKESGRIERVGGKRYGHWDILE